MAEYIEREALLRYLNDIWLTATPTDSMPDDDRQLAIVRCMGLNDAMDAVKETPAADVVPVRHGRWVLNPNLICVGDDFGHWICSECSHEAVFGDKVFDLKRFNFCPNCGAKMDKDGDGE